MKRYRFIGILLIPFIFCSYCMAQTAKKSTAHPVQWTVVSEDEAVTISYNPKIETDKSGKHIVWVKAVYRATDWQWHFANLVGSSQPVISTKTKSMYDENYHYALVRQVICYNKSGKILYDSGDDLSGGWAPVNASDPVGIVGEHLWDKLEGRTGQKAFETNVRENTKEEVETIEKTKSEEVDDDRILDVPEESAEFLGDVYAWLQKNIKYPPICKEQNIQGRVSVQFVIYKDGSIGDIKVLRSPDDNLSKEAERVIQTMPKWKPARQNNKPVGMRYVLPVMFRLP